MHDPRKPVLTPEPKTQEEMREIALSHLIAVTNTGSKALGCTGASFVILGIGLWSHELTDLDAKATAQMLRSLADIYDPSVNDNGKARAEKKRQTAVRKLLAALDLEMATPQGRA